MGISLLRGRVFEPGDNATAPRVVIVNRAMAERFWPGRDALGRTLTYTARGQSGSRTIVGIVDDVHHFGPDRAAEPEFYTPQGQPPTFRRMAVVLRSDVEPAALTTAIRAQVRDLDGEVPIFNVRTLDDLLDRSVGAQRFRTLLMSIFALLALVLAGVGVYGVTAYAMTQRRREIGIRMALGGQRAAVRRFLLAQSLRPIAAGVVIGVAGAYVASQWLATLLFEIAPRDVITFSSVPALLGGIAVLAGYLPARRATCLDPIDALRE